jgi:CDP-diacylglycerol--glycerol-3-phosphate 3-phosphatidyltransferase/cardiolipin synthase
VGQYRARDLYALPNLVSLARVPLAATFPFVLDRPVVALVVLALAGLSDVVDGWLARSRNQVTAVGIVLDPITDKLFVMVVVVSLVVAARLPFPEVLLLATRELGELPLVLWWALSHQKRQQKVAHTMANVPGKLVTVLQFATVAAALLSSPWVHPLLVATAGVGALAACVYAWRDVKASTRSAT